jgi:dTDP-4-dehydrorhamnose reductase
VKNLIITGGSGLLALNWAFFKKNDVEITLLLHNRKVSIEGVNSVFTNLESLDSIYKFLSKNNNAVIIHCAANTSIDDCEKNPKFAYETNVQISKNLAKVCFKLGLKLVHISTDHLFSGASSFYSECSEICPQNVYGDSKAKAEINVMNENPDSLIIRTNFFCWGTPYRISFSDFLINSIREKKKIFLYTDIFYTPIYVKNLIEFVHLLIDSSSAGIYNIVSNERLSKYDFGKRVFGKFSGDICMVIEAEYKNQIQMIKKPLDMSLSNDKLLLSLSSNMESLGDQIEQLKLDETDFKKALSF